MASIGKALVDARTARDLTQTELARRAGISRQALGAIESGAYHPGVAIALRLARELGTTVESLFGEIDDEASTLVEASWSGGARRSIAAAQTRVALARVHGKVVAVAQPSAHLTLATAAGVVQRVRRHRVDVCTFRLPGEIDSTLLMSGCDPAVTILVDWLARRRSPIHAIAIPCSSRAALRALVEGQAHVAGVHLRDQKSGEYNLAPIRRALGNSRSMVVNFARWELGLATAPGNPLAIHSFADLGRPGLRIVNREDGAGARAALDAALGEAGINPDRVAGYQFEVGGHLEVGAAIATGQADAGVTIRLGADVYGLNFIPHRDERYDLVFMADEADSMPVKAMLDALASRRFAREISQLCGYDTAQMGQVVIS
ncbi:MAG: substrate-binding domain-containing protein [Candidatus Binatus sp.]|uniref:substrate-binding domain-containing protein n=1 Tax=Candidatus Binatus sp. TaxID=2811406 RepID=UPI003C9792A5